jgi:DNA-binding response OmpR family regulator
LDDVVRIVVIEDDQLIQAMIEEALSEGGFEAAITTNGEEAVSLLQDNKSLYRAVVTDINLAGKLDWMEGGARCERDRSCDARPIYHRHPRRGLGVKGCS